MNKAWHKAIANKARLKHVYDKYPSKTNWKKYRVQRKSM